MPITTSRTRSLYDRAPRWPYEIAPSYLTDGLVLLVPTFGGVTKPVDLTGLHRPSVIGAELSEAAYPELRTKAFSRIPGAGDSRLDLGPIAATDPLSLSGETQSTILFLARQSDVGVNPHVIDKSDGTNGWRVTTTAGEMAWRSGSSVASVPGWVDDQLHVYGVSTQNLGQHHFHRDTEHAARAAVLTPFSAATTNAAMFQSAYTSGDNGFRGPIYWLAVWAGRALDNEVVDEIARHRWLLFRRRSSRSHHLFGRTVSDAVSVLGGATIEPPVGRLNVLGRVPAVAVGGTVVSVPIGAATITGVSPTIAAGETVVSAPFGAVSVTGQPPVVLPGATVISAPVGSLTLTAESATVLVGPTIVQVPVGLVSVAGQPPVIAAGPTGGYLPAPTHVAYMPPRRSVFVIRP